VSFRLVCTGGILPGFDHLTVSHNLVCQLGITPEQAERILSGKPITLKRGVAEDKLPQYMHRFAQTGLVVHTEPELSVGKSAAVLPFAAQQATPPAVQRPATLPSLESSRDTARSDDEVECPDCHERQPRSTTCRKCARNISQDLFARASIASETQETLGNTTHTGYESVQTSHGKYGPSPTDDDEAPPACIGLTFSGRFSRRSMLRANIANVALMALLATLGMSIAGPNAIVPIFFTAFLGATILNMRNASLRFHDLGTTGWLAILMLIPGVDSLLVLLLLFMPGQSHANAYGPKTTSSSWASIFVALILLGASSYFFMEVGLRQWNRQQLLAAQTMAGRDIQKWEGTDPYEVIMYSQTTCSACTERREQLRAEGIQFTELMVDKDAAALRELNTKLQSAAFHDRLTTPSFVINGRLLINDPSLTLIHRAMRQPMS